jgi:hypothetical protein
MLQAAFLTFSKQYVVILPVMGIAAGLYSFFQGLRSLRRKRLILKTPASKIRSASMGMVEISGMAVGPHVVKSPLKKAECFYYRSVAWELRQNGRTGGWVKVAEEVLHVPFYLDDSTDKLLIDPRGAEMDLHCDFHEEYEGDSLVKTGHIPGTVSEFLLRHNVNASGKIKLEEYCIKPESFLFVLGTLSQNPGLDMSVTPPWASRMGEAPAEPGPPEEAVPENGSQKVIRLSVAPAALPATEMTQQQKIAAALVKAGISATPWSPPVANTKPAQTSASRAATAVAEKSAPVDTIGFDLHPPVVLMKGSDEPTFFISWRSQRDAVNSLNWRSICMIWGGLGLALACVYDMVAHFR